MKRVIFLAAALALVITMDAHAAPIKISDNGAWSWFQDQRAVVDPATGRLIVGSTANGRFIRETSARTVMST